MEKWESGGSKYTDGELISMFKDFVEKNGRLPFIKDFCKKNNMPTLYTVYIPRIGKDYLDVIKNCGFAITDEVLQRYNREINSKMTKNDAIRSVLNLEKDLGRPLMYDDFRFPKPNNIGIGTVKRIWGSMNKMKEDLGLVINQESMMDKAISLPLMKERVTELCRNIFLDQNRKNIWDRDLDTLGVKANTIRLIFSRSDENMREFIESIGFTLQKPGMGCNHHYDDGEHTQSLFEYIFTNTIRNMGFVYNKNYKTNVRYKTFIPNYSGFMNCDYAFEINNGRKFYLEIAGIISGHAVAFNELKFCDSFGKTKTDYVMKLKEKEKMFIDNNLEYFILIPSGHDHIYLQQVDSAIKHITSLLYYD